LLAAGHDAVCIDNYANSSPVALQRVQEITGRSVTAIEGDVRDAGLLDRVFAEHPIDAVIHFAAKRRSANRSRVACVLSAAAQHLGDGRPDRCTSARSVRCRPRAGAAPSERAYSEAGHTDAAWQAHWCIIRLRIVLAGPKGKQMNLALKQSLRKSAAAGIGAALVSACATTQMEAQWRDPQLAPQSLQGKTVLVVCRGLDLTLERICEDKLAAQVQAIGVKVARSDSPPAVADDALLQAAKVAGAEVVLATTLQPAGYDVAPTGGSVGIGVGGSSGGYGSRSGGAIGLSLPIGGASGPGIGASTNLTEAASGKLLWSSRARSPKTSSEADQISELSRVTVEALKGAQLF